MAEYKQYHTCWFGTCTDVASREHDGNYYCAPHFRIMVKESIVQKYNEVVVQKSVEEQKKERKKEQDKRITIEFCMWLQDTDVFSAFTDHLNKGMKLEEFDVNPKALKAKA